MQVNGKPALAELLRPERRVHLYGASPYWSYFHLGEARAQERAVVRVRSGLANQVRVRVS